MMQNPPALEELLTRTAAEIARCRSMVVTLEDAVHSLVQTASAGAASELTRDLQILDLLDQHLQDLCRWTEGLAEASRGVQISRDLGALVNPLRLDDLRRSLGGAAPPALATARRTEVF